MLTKSYMGKTCESCGVTCYLSEKVFSIRFEFRKILFNSVCNLWKVFFFSPPDFTLAIFKMEEKGLLPHLFFWDFRED